MKLKYFQDTILPMLRTQYTDAVVFQKQAQLFVDENEITDDEGNPVTVSAIALTTTAEPEEEPSEEPAAEPTTEANYAAMRKIVREELKAHKPASPVATVKVHERIDDDPKRGFKCFGEFLGEVLKVGDAKSGRMSDSPKLKAVTGQSVGVDSDGGFLAPPEFQKQMLEKVTAVGSVMNPPGGASVFNLPFSTGMVEIPYIDETSRATGSRGGSLQAYWVSEGGQHTVETVKTGKLQLKANKVVGAAALTEELISDNVMSVEAIIGRLLVDELTWTIENAIMNGTGAGKPRGIVGSACTIDIAKEDQQDAETVVYENINKMWARLWASSRSSAVWFINQDLLPELENLQMPTGLSGYPVFLPPGGLTDAPFARLKGRPVIEVEYCQTLGTSGDIVLADMSQYVYATKGAIDQQSSIHLRFDYGETVLRFTMRADGSPWWSSALTPANGSNTVSPFLTLAVRE